MTRTRLFLGALIGALALAGAASAASADVQISPVTRLPFPERGFVVSVPTKVDLEARGLVVRENGLRVPDVRIEPLSDSGLRFGVVLAIDASESMTGAPAAAALEAGRAFVSRRAENQAIGVVAFNGAISVLQSPTRDEAALRRTFAAEPALAYGTRIHDALLRSLALLKPARLSSGAIVLLSDGADIGSVSSLDAAVAAAKEQQVRIFTVGLRSGAFDPAPLAAIAERTGGGFAEAGSTRELARIYDELGERLAGEFLVRYRSSARPMSQVDVAVSVAGVGAVSTAYVAPTPSLLPPYHRSALSKFLLSAGSPLIVSAVVGLLVCLLLLVLTRRPKETVVDRVRAFAKGSRTQRRADSLAEVLRAPVRAHYSGGWWARLERDLELGRMTVTPRQVVGLSVAASAVIVLVSLIVSAPVLGFLGLGTPLLARAVIRRKVRSVRSQFADQFPASLQVLASALRSGHSFAGALAVVVDNAREPARSELARVLQDERLGVLPEDAIRKLARRMANRDIEQVALLAELQRTAGGNSAEILDTVVATIRERAEIRRLVRTLTAQGRMSRWILTALPVFLAAFLWLSNPASMNQFVSSSVGQVSLTLAAVMVLAGSLMIQRIVDIDV